MELSKLVMIDEIGGVYVNSHVSSAFSVEGEITIDFAKLPNALITRLCTAYRNGYRLSYRGPIGSLVEICTKHSGIKVPPVGFMGKKNMHIAVPSNKAEKYMAELTAAAALTDVDVSAAILCFHCGWYPDVNGEKVSYNTLDVNGWKVKWMHKVRESISDLAPMTSRVAPLVQMWQKELLPLRQPMIDWIVARPRLTFDITTKGE